MNRNTQLADAFLFDAKPVYRFQSVVPIMQFFPEPHFGKDPPYGASINYWLKKENKKVKVHILNEAGDTMRTLKHEGKERINRVWWNLKGKPTEQILMRTKPQYADWLPLAKDRTRKPRLSPRSILLPPGEYRVHLEAGAETEIQILEVLKDPNSEGSMDDIMAQHELSQNIYDDLNSVSENINEMEEMRRQLLDLKAMLKAKELHKSVQDTISHFHKSLVDIESKMVQLKYTGHGQDAVRYPAQLAERLNYLAGTASVGDFKPADPHIEVFELLHGRLSDYLSEYQNSKSDELVVLRAILDEHGVGVLIE